MYVRTVGLEPGQGFSGPVQLVNAKVALRELGHPFLVSLLLLAVSVVVEALGLLCLRRP